MTSRRTFLEAGLAVAAFGAGKLMSVGVPMTFSSAFRQSFVGCLGGAEDSDLTVLLRDEFTTPQNPVTWPRTCEPGPGVLQGTDSTGKMSIVAGALHDSGSITTNDPLVYDTTTRARVPGLIMMVGHRSNASEAAIRTKRWAFHPSLAINPNLNSWQISHIASSYAAASSGRVFWEETITVGGTYTFGIAVQATGAFWVLKGPGHTVWELAAATSATGAGDATTDPLYALYTHTGSFGANDTDTDFFTEGIMAGWDNGGPYDLNSAGSISPGSIFTHPTQFIANISYVRPSAGSIKIGYRKQDASNYYYVELPAAGGIRLHKVTAGSDATLTTVSGGTVPGVLAINVTGGMHFINTNTTQAVSRTTESSFTSATQFEILDTGTGGSVSDLYLYNKLVGPEISALLDRLEMGL